jgi:hypothetical protein
LWGASPPQLYFGFYVLTEMAINELPRPQAVGVIHLIGCFNGANDWWCDRLLWFKDRRDRLL